jgi:hypothetical protein
VKDLPDLALLATAQPIDANRLRAALEQTFTFRKTHTLPVAVVHLCFGQKARYLGWGPAQPWRRTNVCQ